jgi:hypothetical protein
MEQIEEWAKEPPPSPIKHQEYLLETEEFTVLITRLENGHWGFMCGSKSPHYNASLGGRGDDRGEMARALLARMKEMKKTIAIETIKDVIHEAANRVADRVNPSP